MIVVIRQFVQEGPGLENEGGQHHFGQIHARSDLLQQSPDQRFVFFRYRLGLSSLASLQNERKDNRSKRQNVRLHTLKSTLFACKSVSSNCENLAVTSGGV